MKQFILEVSRRLWQSYLILVGFVEILSRLRSDLGRQYEQPEVPWNELQVNRVYVTISSDRHPIELMIS